MCGIIGGIDQTGAIGREHVVRALACMQRRGPDAEGIYENAPVFLGHKRLSIIDLDVRANQPMRVGKLVITFNGEIYNYRAVRDDLMRLGTQFFTQSDTEVVAAAFRHEGLACLRRFEGMFAFAIWDEDAKKLTLARDRFGEKPLVYYHDRERFFFASEIAPLEALIGRGQLQVDDEAIGLYFRYSFIPAPYAPYRHMRQLEPGSWLEFDIASGELRGGRYWELKPQPRAITKQAAMEELRQRLSDSVKLRLSAADVPVATFLSGGVDSSIISALVAREAANVRAYSIGFPKDPGFDESPYARMVAARYPALQHRVIDVNERSLLDFTDRTLSALGEPYADASIVPTAFLCSQVEEKVILGGDGADELFAGYGVYAAMRLSARIPGALKSLLLALPVPGNPHAIAQPQLRALALLRRHMKRTPQEEYLSWRSYMQSHELQALGIASPAPELDDAPLRTLNDLLALDIGFNLPSDMLKKVDLASMQHSVEVRLPYLDSGLAEFALSLPEKLLIHRRERKYILRETFRDLLPEAIFTRRKQGFLLPIRRWFKNGDLKDRLLGMIGASCPLDSQRLHRLLAEHEGGKYDHSAALWSCYAFLTWHNRPKNL